jgi:hypothetical protein
MDPAVESYTMLQIMVNEDLKRRCPITKFWKTGLFKWRRWTMANSQN